MSKQGNPQKCDHAGITVTYKSPPGGVQAHTNKTDRDIDCHEITGKNTLNTNYVSEMLKSTGSQKSN